ncbi:MAG: lipopolysaccharide assembly protein LapA domain-containing protein [Liquorilactobacillus hordei]|uniref:lipopolysaccharide assembly protein LapA domain-containing protein n=1 Tax=Liquorilactobacillus hordei TaxID=468911 RepID=UPI0039EBC477
MKNQWRMIVALLIALVVVIFALLNTQKVELNFLFGKFSLPLVLILVVSLLLGALVAVLVSTVTIVSLRRELKKKNDNEEQIKKQLEDDYQKKLTEVRAKYQRKVNDNRTNDLNLK